MARRVICGVDGSSESLKAARVAEGLCADLGAELVFAFVAGAPLSVVHGLPIARRGVELGTRKWGWRMLQRLHNQGVLPAGRCRVEYGHPSAGLVEIASLESADLIVLGSRGRGRIGSAMLGSVSQEVASRAFCPTLIVPADSPEV